MGKKIVVAIILVAVVISLFFAGEYIFANRESNPTRQAYMDAYAEKGGYEFDELQAKKNKEDSIKRIEEMKKAGN